MSLFRKLWHDEAGVILSAEAVLVGTVGVIGVVAGLSTISHAIDGELRDTAFAIRSLDQSYYYRGHVGCHSWTAGSCFIQRPVQESLIDIGRQSDADVQAIQQEIDAYRKQTDGSVQPEEKSTKPMKPTKKKKAKKGPTIDESTLQLEPNDLPASKPTGSL